MPTQTRSQDTRTALIHAAIEALREVGYAGASAREIARRAGVNQALIFYHFGSVVELLLAALDEVSAQRMAAYSEAVEAAETLPELIESARAIFAEDLDAGRVTVLVEMITGAQSTNGLGEQVAVRLAPWREFAAVAVRKVLARSPIPLLVPAEEIAHGVVAGFLGLELLANLDGDRGAALALFDRARALAGVLELAAVAFPDANSKGGHPR
jgi:AcrR family transcriptional regulator